MEVLNAFIFNDSKYDVNIQTENGVTYFQASDIGKVLEIKNIHTSIANFDEDEKVLRELYTPGGTQEATFLTEIGVYRLIMKSKKPIARPFQKWVCNVIKTINGTGRYELLAEQHQELQSRHLNVLENEANMRNKLQLSATIYSNEQNDAARASCHYTMLETLNQKHTNYIAYIKDFEPNEHGVKQDIVKIGWSNDIKERARSLIERLGNFQVLHAVECHFNVHFEKQLHKRYEHRKFSGEINNGHKSSETFILTQKEIEDVKDFMRKESKRYNEIFTAASPSEYRRNEVMESLDPIINEVQERVNTILEPVNENLERNRERDNDILVSAQTSFNVNLGRQYTVVHGKKVQRYSNDGNVLLETYECMAAATRDIKLDSPMWKSIRESVKNKSVYKGFRWAFLERDQPDNTIQDIGETNEMIIPTNKGYVAMLNPQNTRIEKVYCDMKAATEDLELKSVASISNAVKRESKCLGRYFKMWFDCDENLKQDYLHGNVLPPNRVKVNGKPIEQICPFTQNVVKKYSSVNDLIKEQRVGRGSIIKALDNYSPLKGYLWKYS